MYQYVHSLGYGLQEDAYKKAATEQLQRFHKILYHIKF